MARIPSSWATSGTSSTSSLTKWAPGYTSENLFFVVISMVVKGGREG